jgi:hypothetical protein
MIVEYKDLTCEQRSEMFDDIQAFLQKGLPVNEIKLKIMATYGITDTWSGKSRWDIKSLEEFIRRVKDWSETIIIEDII